MDVNQASISKRILNLKNELNLNQKQFAELLGVTQPAVSKFAGSYPSASGTIKIGENSEDDYRMDFNRGR